MKLCLTKTLFSIKVDFKEGVMWYFSYLNSRHVLLFGPPIITDLPVKPTNEAFFEIMEDIEQFFEFNFSNGTVIKIYI